MSKNRFFCCSKKNYFAAALKFPKGKAPYLGGQGFLTGTAFHHDYDRHIPPEHFAHEDGLALISHDWNIHKL